MDDTGQHVRVRATINLSGLPAGTETLVDPEIPYIARCLDAGFLVPASEDAADIPVEPPPTEGEAAEEQPVA